MTTALFTHPACLQHDTGPSHPERSDRLQAVLAALQDLPLLRRDAPRAHDEQVLRVHTPRLLARLKTTPPGMLDADTVISEGSLEAALRAAGAVCAAVDSVVAGDCQNAFCAVRPPGHHAEPDRAMGFCLLNNVAIGALHARAAHGLQRVAVVDFDVHHGNGTQEAAWQDPDFFFASSHQWPFYPGSGRAEERGAHDNIINVPLTGGCGSHKFRAAWTNTLLPALEAFGPEMILISAGFDAHAADPLGGMGLETADFGWITAEILGIARRNCAGKVISTLEGGYNLAALADSARLHVQALLGLL